jgi:hypothetical protein
MTIYNIPEVVGIFCLKLQLQTTSYHDFVLLEFGHPIGMCLETDFCPLWDD